MVNQKGGVGKTTVTLGLAEAAAAIGLRVLVVDLDPQANATSGLAVWSAEATVDDVLAGRRAGGLLEVVVRSGWNLPLPAPATGNSPPTHNAPELAPGSPLLAQREPTLAADPLGAQERLRLSMAGVDHDLVLIDCPPSLGLLSVNGLFAADGALVVTEPAAWAADGVDLMARTIEQVAARRGTPDLIGIVVNRLGRTRDNVFWNGELAERFGTAMLPPIQLRAAIAEASAQSLPLRALGSRPGAPEAVEQFDALLSAIRSRG